MSAAFQHSSIAIRKYPAKVSFNARRGSYTLAYNALFRHTSLPYPNGVKATYQYDAASRLTVLLNLETGAFDTY